MKGNLPYRQTIRIKEHNYSKEGCYFITISSMDRLCCFGHIENGTMIINGCGQITQECIGKIPELYPEVTVPCSAVMPDHVHLIINIKDMESSIQSNADESKFILEAMRKRSKDLVPKIVQQFKAATVRHAKQAVLSRKIDKQNAEIDQAQRLYLPNQMIYWHRGYYDRIVRNNDEFQAICKYIMTNPVNWIYGEHISSDLPD